MGATAIMTDITVTPMAQMMNKVLNIQNRRIHLAQSLNLNQSLNLKLNLFQDRQNQKQNQKQNQIANTNTSICINTNATNVSMTAAVTRTTQDRTTQDTRKPLDQCC